jgi:hypothetical protein
MKAYKITGKLGDICSFVGGNEVKKGDTVYFHSESDMKQQCVAKTQENDMSIEAMKLALEALERLKAYGNVFRFRQDEQNPYDQACEAIESLRQAIANEALNKMAENARELGLDYEPVPWIENMTIDSTNELSKPTAPVQEPFGYLWPTGRHPEFRFTQQLRDGVEGTPVYTTPQPQREWVGLTDAEIEEFDYYARDLVMDIEKALKERNNVA